MSVSQATHVRWSEMSGERLSPLIERRYLSGEHLTVAQFFLRKGCLVPTHVHENEQFANIVQGCLRFRLGEGGEVVDVRAGEALLIPPGLPHSAEALEDSMVFDSFSPPRQDWIEKRDDYLRR